MGAFWPKIFVAYVPDSNMVIAIEITAIRMMAITTLDAG
jgi:hypothetical protein